MISAESLSFVLVTNKKKMGENDAVSEEKLQQRILELERALEVANNDASILRSKVALWCRASKKHQVLLQVSLLLFFLFVCLFSSYNCFFPGVSHSG